LLIAASMVGFTTVATRNALASISVARLLAATAVLYGVPMVLALATVDLLRRNRVPRWLGIVVVLCVSMASLLVVGYASSALLGLVEAVG
jgi:hypothetical protein